MRFRRLPASLVIVTFALLAIKAASETIDPNNDGSQYAWSENAGWLNAEPLGSHAPGMNITLDGVDGWLWSENLGWISLSCENTASCAIVDHRVEHDGGRNLYGYAWSEYAGWVNFSCLSSGSCATVDFGVEIDLVTGELSGYAWCENVGWISFSCLDTGSCGTVDYGIRTTIPLPDPIFSDGFESGDTTGWS